MATLESEQQQRVLLLQLLSELSNTTISELERVDLGSDLNFKSGNQYFDRLIRLFRGFNDADFTDVPYSALTRLVQVAQQARNTLQQVREFSVAKYSNNLLQQRESMINQARDQYDAAFDAITPILAFTIRKGTDFERLEADARTLLDKMETTVARGETALQASMKQAEDALTQVRAAAQEAGVSQHAIHFKEEAATNEKSARPWLLVTSGLAISTVLLGIGLTVEYFYKIPVLTPSQSIQVAIPKLFVFSVLLSATVWCGKTYRAYRHNAVLNRHRQNALATFQAFAKAASDQATKDAVLLQATQCIFSQQPTGYIQTEPEPTALPISEMMKAIGK